MNEPEHVGIQVLGFINEQDGGFSTSILIFQELAEVAEGLIVTSGRLYLVFLHNGAQKSVGRSEIGRDGHSRDELVIVVELLIDPPGDGGLSASDGAGDVDRPDLVGDHISTLS